VAAGSPAARLPGEFLAGWRGLARFWILVLLACGALAGVIQVLGPAAPPPALTPAPLRAGFPLPINHTAAPVPTHPAAPPSTATATHSVPQSPLSPTRPGRQTAGPIADPDPSLLESYPGPDASTLSLPRIAPDGRAPMAVYAAGFDPSNTRPRVGIVIAGIGMSDADSLSAIQDLPPGVTLAISPYATNIGHLLQVARLSEHEYLLSVPMEPQGYPINDPDDRHALMTSLPPAENLVRLRWILSRLTGYVGVTDALGPMHGERLAAMPSQLDPVLAEAARRGLLFVDARAGQPFQAEAWGRSIDLAIDDDPVDAATLDQRLDKLTHLALDKGAALGLVSVPRPVTLARVAAWTTTLAAKGVALAPVSALALPPAKQDTTK
jgi:polysaccharide deacetylase 2 family uncharacterized protein YibQ